MLCVFLGIRLAAGCGSLLAHDVPDRFFDRAVQVTIQPDRISVTYELSLTQLTLAQELLSLVGPGGLSGTGPAERLDRFAQEMGPLLARGLFLRVNDIERPVQFVTASHRVEEHPKFQFEMQSSSVAGPDIHRQLKLEDTNYFLEKGRLRIAISAAVPCELEKASVPSQLEEIQIKASWETSPEEQDAARRVEATWRMTSGESAGWATSDAMTSPSHEAPKANSANELSPPGTAKESTGNSEERGLIGLFDQRSGRLAIMLLGLAFFFGAAHAMTPGHGKTMVAAYLVGERGTLRHAVGLGLTTSLTHTGSVLAVAAVLALLGPALEQRLNAGLSLLSGMLVAGLGAGLLITRIRRRAIANTGAVDHTCSGDQVCGQHANPNAGESTSFSGPSWSSMLALGVSGGIVPCWDAVALLLFAAAEGQIARAIYLLVSFSAGLASALVSVGILAVKLRGYLSSRIGTGRIVQSLPVISAAAILVVGVYLCVLTLQHPVGWIAQPSPAANRTAGN